MNLYHLLLSLIFLLCYQADIYCQSNDEIGLKNYEFDSNPQFKSGEIELQAYIYNNLILPLSKKDSVNNINETAIVSFMIEANGKINTIEIVNDVGYGTAKEIIEMVRFMEGLWIPAKKDGIYIDQKHNLPIAFRKDNTYDNFKARKKEERKNKKKKRKNKVKF